MRLRTGAATLAFVLAFVINPALLGGCARLGLTFDFGEREVVALVESANHGGPYPFSSDGRELAVTFSLSQSASVITSAFSVGGSSLVAQALACDHRTFVRSAHACLDSTTLPVEGTLTVRDAGGAILVDAAHVKGELRVIGTHLRNVELTVTDGKGLVQLRSRDGKTFAVDSVSLGA
jgi:hypothetical protein